MSNNRISTSYSKYPAGTLVRFPRKGRDNTGARKDWDDEGIIKKIEVYSYVIVNHRGELFVRSFDEVEKVQQ